jgi:hypothetical protein
MSRPGDLAASGGLGTQEKVPGLSKTLIFKEALEFVPFLGI